MLVKTTSTFDCNMVESTVYICSFDCTKYLDNSYRDFLLMVAA